MCDGARQLLLQRTPTEGSYQQSLFGKFLVWSLLILGTVAVQDYRTSLGCTNNHINCIIKILNFVNLSLKENVIISVFILKVPILQPYGNNSTGGFFFLRIVFCL